MLGYCERVDKYASCCPYCMSYRLERRRSQQNKKFWKSREEMDKARVPEVMLQPATLEEAMVCEGGVSSSEHAVRKMGGEGEDI